VSEFPVRGCGAFLFGRRSLRFHIFQAAQGCLLRPPLLFRLSLSFIRMNLVRRWFFLVLLLSLPGCKSTDVSTGDLPPVGQLPTAPVVGQDNSVQPGDSIEIFVTEDSSFNAVVPVRETGEIILPRLGRVVVQGLGIRQVEARVKQALESSQLQKATVIAAISARANRPTAVGGLNPGQPTIQIFLSGSVARAGAHQIPVPPGRTLGVYDAILIGGGFGRFADDRRVRLRRSGAGGTGERTINVRDIREGKASDVPIGPGDIIIVPEKTFSTF
jgi:protein involved in polysaccharide export with SLBB domain